MTMMHYIVVREEAPDKFVAYPCGLPELTVTASSYVVAVAGARAKCVEWIKQGKLVPVNVTVPVEDLDPPPPVDPERAELEREAIAEMARQRQLEDEQFGCWKVDPGDEEGRRWVEETIRYRKEHLKGTIWDYEIPWPDSSSTPTTSPTTSSATPASAPESPASPPVTSP